MSGEADSLGGRVSLCHTATHHQTDKAEAEQHEGARWLGYRSWVYELRIATLTSVCTDVKIKPEGVNFATGQVEV